MPTYASVTGRVTLTGTSIGMKGRVDAYPLTTNQVINLPAENWMQKGPATAYTGDDGTLLAPLQIPQGGEPVGQRFWRLVFSPEDRRVPAWTLRESVEITADSDISDLVDTVVTSVSASVLDDVTAQVAAAEAARTGAETARDEAVAVGNTNDTIIAGRVNDPASQTHAALSATYVKGLRIHPGVAGVVGNGTGNDTAAIQAILDQVSPALGVVDVFISDGTYMIDGVNDSGDLTPWGQSGNQTRNWWMGGGLLPKSGTRLHLSPGAILKIIPNSSPAYSCIFLGKDQNNITISGGQILGDRATHDYATEPTYTTHEYGFGISLRGAKDVTIENVKVSGCTGDSIFISPQGLIGLNAYHQAERVTIRGCTLDAARRNNLSILGCDLVTIENNWITNAGTNDGIKDGTLPRFGIDIEGYGEGATDYEIPWRVTVRGNKFAGNVNGSVMNFNGYNVVIDGNHADHTISYGYGTETVISNNVLDKEGDTTRVAISSNSGGTNPYPANTIITNNVINGFGTGIQASREGVTIIGNHVRGFANKGITLFGATDSAIVDNHITNGTGASAVGIDIGTSTTVQASRNSIHNTRTGVVVQTTSTNVQLAGNVITKALQGIDIKANCQAIIKGNITDLPGHAAGQSYDITWASTAAVVCEGNTLRNSSSYAISAASGGTGGISRILRNQIVNSTAGTGISCTSGAHEVIGNDIIHNRATSVTSSILLASASGSRVIENTVYNAGAGAVTAIHTSGSSSTRIARNTLQGGATTVINHATTDTIADNTIVGGGVTSKTANYTATVADRTILATGGASGITITLPAALSGLRYEIKKVDAGAGAVTIATTSSQTIDGATTRTLAAQWDKVIVVSDGTAWFTV